MNVRDMRAILNQITDTDDYRAIVEAGGGIRSEWWKLISAVADMHPAHSIADALFAAYTGNEEVYRAFEGGVKTQLARKNIRDLTIVAKARSMFEVFGRDVRRKLADPAFIKDCNDKNKDHAVLDRTDIDKLLKNMQVVLEALAKLFS